MDGTSNQGTEHVQNWLKKLKESQDRKKDEKIRRYNDVVSKLIILLIGVCIVCVIVIAALIVQNESLKNSYDLMISTNNTTYNSGQLQVQSLQSQISTLQSDNQKYRDFIFSNRTPNIVHTVSVDSHYPNITRIVYDNYQITLYFIDGTSKTTQFTSPEFNF